ncbi:hypothetical protein D3C75_1358260 [compost metagenome]
MEHLAERADSAISDEQAGQLAVRQQWQQSPGEKALYGNTDRGRFSPGNARTLASVER